MNEQAQAIEQLQQEWGIVAPDVVSEEELLQLLAQKIVALIERSPEEFFQLMYRLDIEEQKLNRALHEQDIAQNIAKIIYDRQLMKMRTRQLYKQAGTEEDGDLMW